MITQKQIEQIMALKKSGLGVRRIAKQLKLSTGTVWKYLKKQDSPGESAPESAKEPIPAQMDVLINSMVQEFQCFLLSPKLMQKKDLSIEFLDLSCKILREHLSNLDPLLLENLAKPKKFTPLQRFDFVYLKVLQKAREVQADKKITDKIREHMVGYDQLSEADSNRNSKTFKE